MPSWPAAPFVTMYSGSSPLPSAIGDGVTTVPTTFPLWKSCPLPVVAVAGNAATSAAAVTAASSAVLMGPPPSDCPRSLPAGACAALSEFLTDSEREELLVRCRVALLEQRPLRLLGPGALRAEAGLQAQLAGGRADGHPRDVPVVTEGEVC